MTPQTKKLGKCCKFYPRTPFHTKRTDRQLSCPLNLCDRLSHVYLAAKMLFPSSNLFHTRPFRNATGLTSPSSGVLRVAPELPASRPTSHHHSLEGEMPPLGGLRWGEGRALRSGVSLWNECVHILTGGSCTDLCTHWKLLSCARQG